MDNQTTDSNQTTDNNQALEQTATIQENRAFESIEDVFSPGNVERRRLDGIVAALVAGGSLSTHSMEDTITLARAILTEIDLQLRSGGPL